MGTKEKPTMLDRLLEMVRRRDEARPEAGSRKADQVQSGKAGKRRKRAAQGA